MQDVKITGLTIAEGMKPTQKGSRIIAYFACDVGPFSFVGCALVRTARNGVGIRLPKLDDAYGAIRSVKLNCDATRNAIMQAARDVYRMMGGTEAEWIGRDGEVETSHYIPPETDEGEDRGGLETFLQSKNDDRPQDNG